MQATPSALGLSLAPPIPSTAGPAPGAAGGGGGGGLGSLPAPLSKAVERKHTADALLQSLAQQSHATATPRPVAEARGTTAAPTSLPGRARVALEQCIDAAEQCQIATHARLSDEERARALFCLGWAKARLAQLVQPDALPAQLELALDSLNQATRLVTWFPSEPPHLAATPSVTRPTDPNRHQASLDRLALVPAWGAELVAELARAQTILALAKAMSIQEQRGSSKVDGGAAAVAGDEDDRQLADLIDLACRRNVQALFTPVDPHSAQMEPAGPSAIGAGQNGGGPNSTIVDGVDEHQIGGNSSLADASTVLGNARLLRDVLSALLPYTTDPSAWKLRLDWATHIADVQFVSASLSANRLVDVASAEATKLQNSHISPRERQEVKRVLEKTARRMAPYEMRQGNVLLWLGRVMLDAVGALYLGRTEEGFQAERRRREQQALAASSGGNGGMTEEDFEEEEDEADASAVPVPENDLVRETRQVLIRGALSDWCGLSTGRRADHSLAFHSCGAV